MTSGNTITTTRPARLYLAYGSNLNKEQMKWRCPNARPVGRVMFENAMLVFRGVADVIECQGSAVPMGIWRITPSDERALDSYEGTGSGLYSKEEVWLPNGKSALIYLMNDSGVMPPSQRYADTIRKGYKDFGLDESYLDAAIARSFDDKAPSRVTSQRRARQRVSSNEQMLVKRKCGGLS